MFKEYLYTQHLSPSQIEGLKNFNNSSEIEYETLKNCEICESEKISLLFKNDRYGISQKTCFCNNCGFMFLNPRMTKKSMEYFYNSDLYRIIYGVIDKNFDKEKMFENIINEMKEHKPLVPKKPDFNIYYSGLYFDFINSEIQDFETVLDVGCGKGIKLLDFNSIGKKAYGIEPSEFCNQIHRELGLNSEIGFLKDVKQSYDLVILTHVFEHLTELKKNVDHLHNITNKYLFIEVPGHVKNLQSIQNAHNYYFSLNTLNYFFLNNKFKLIKIDYAKDNEFICALYEKTEEKTYTIFDKKLELKNLRNLKRNYFFKYIFIKILKLLKIEKNVRKIYSKIKENI